MKNNVNFEHISIIIFFCCTEYFSFECHGKKLEVNNLDPVSAHNSVYLYVNMR